MGRGPTDFYVLVRDKEVSLVKHKVVNERLVEVHVDATTAQRLREFVQSTAPRPCRRRTGHRTSFLVEPPIEAVCPSESCLKYPSSRPDRVQDP